MYIFSTLGLEPWGRIGSGVAKHDPGNQFAVNHLWGTDALGFNVQKAKQVAPDAPLDSWKVLFDPAWAAKFKDCGISVLDAPDEVIGVVLAYLGKDPNSEVRGM